VDREGLLLAALGASCAVITWLVFATLTQLGKMPWLLFPLALVIAFVGAVLASTPFAGILWASTGMAMLGFCVIALTPFVMTVLPTKAYVRNDKIAGTHVDAVVVLSGGITGDSLLEPEALDRLLTGLALMRDSVAPVLVVTQPRSLASGATAAPDQARLRALVMRPFLMLTVDSVHTTHDEAVNAWRLLRPRGAIHVAVVTSPLHTRRACATFEHVGFTVTCVSAVSRAYSVDHPSIGQDRVALFRAWFYERAATLEYRLRGWIDTNSTR
jgi:uncharacterized SAM-binding protein YcdF (DUF218 family)